MQHLEIPFFIGVVTRSPPQMDVYTAELLPLVFARFGIPDKLWLRPVAKEDYDPTKYCWGTAVDGVHLNCPYVSTFGAIEDRSTLQPKVDVLNTVCSRASSNIATRKSEEHIYETDSDGHLVIVAGCGSVQYFRNNFCKRLAEVFYNLKWIFEHQRDAFRIDEIGVST